MSLDKYKVAAASALTAAGLAWPTLLCAATDAMLTPYQRALSASWCGQGQATLEILGHCPACWAGTAAFLLAAIAVLQVSRPRRQLAAA